MQQFRVEICFSLAGAATAIIAPATMLIAPDAEAQQTDETPPAGQTAPKKKKAKGSSSSGAATQTKQPKEQ
jgi:hypothetical protein